MLIFLLSLAVGVEDSQIFNCKAMNYDLDGPAGILEAGIGFRIPLCDPCTRRGEILRRLTWLWPAARMTALGWGWVPAHSPCVRLILLRKAYS